MRRGTGVADTTTVSDYIDAVARCVHADAVDWWKTDGAEAVLVLPFRLHYLPGRNAVMMWNRSFGWSLGAEGLGRRSVVVIDGFGLGRMPGPVQCADRAAEMIEEYCQSTPALPGRIPETIGSPSTEDCPRIRTEYAGDGRRDRVIRRP